jgi:hypothetical protein
MVGLFEEVYSKATMKKTQFTSHINVSVMVMQV